MSESDERNLIEAIGNKTARPTATRLIEHGSEVAPLAGQVLRATDGILARVQRELDALGSIPELADVELQPDASGQLHHLRGTLGGWVEAAPVVAALREQGWVTWHDLTDTQELALYRSVDRVTLAQLEDDPLTVELAWDNAPFARLPSPLRPVIPDISVIELPEKLWPLYAAVRPARLLAERTGRLAGRSRSLGPILSTPKELIGPLLELAEIGPDDHLVDLGCGEGRVLIEAHRTVDCRVTGVETDLRLVERARQTIASELDGDSRAQVVHGDAATYDLGDATAVFLFIPAEAIGDVVRRLRAQGFRGRIVSHEQAALPTGLAPASSHILATDSALTVAHLW